MSSVGQAPHIVSAQNCRCSCRVYLVAVLAEVSEIFGVNILRQMSWHVGGKIFFQDLKQWDSVQGRTEFMMFSRILVLNEYKQPRVKRDLVWPITLSVLVTVAPRMQLHKHKQNGMDVWLEISSAWMSGGWRVMRCAEGDRRRQEICQGTKRNNAKYNSRSRIASWNFAPTETFLSFGRWRGE